MVIHANFFLSVEDLFPVIHSWSFVDHSSIFRVVDLVCVVSYTLAEDKWIFSSLLLIFPLCH